MSVFRAVCAIALIASATTVSAKVRTPSDQDKLQASCYPDVQRLCKDAIPDEGKITACMKHHAVKVSVACKEAYKATQAD